MLLRIKALAAKGGVSLQGETELTELLKDRQDILSFKPAVAELRADLSDGLVKVTGNVHTDLVVACSRCLQPVQVPIDAPFLERFAAKQEDVPEELEDDVHLVTEDPVNVTPFIEETLALSIPMVTLCSEDCKGLCPDCGANRNEQECGCKDDKIDPRLAGLADFFKE